MFLSFFYTHNFYLKIHFCISSSYSIIHSVSLLVCVRCRSRVKKRSRIHIGITRWKRCESMWMFRVCTLPEQKLLCTAVGGWWKSVHVLVHCTQCAQVKVLYRCIYRYVYDQYSSFCRSCAFLSTNRLFFFLSHRKSRKNEKTENRTTGFLTSSENTFLEIFCLFFFCLFRHNCIVYEVYLYRCVCVVLVYAFSFAYNTKNIFVLVHIKIPSKRHQCPTIRLLFYMFFLFNWNLQ